MKLAGKYVDKFWAKRNVELKALMDKYTEEYLRGTQFEFGVGDRTAWLEIKDTLLNPEESLKEEVQDSGQLTDVVDIGKTKLEAKLLADGGVDPEAGTKSVEMVDNDFGLMIIER